MRVALVALLALGASCGRNDNPGQSVCDNVVPAPAACMSMCDPSPGAVNTCPGGYHCAPDGFCDARCTASGGECGEGYRCTPEGRCVGEDTCVGLECQIAKCDAMGMPPTTITGTVFAPNGSLPLFGVNVYVPNAALPPVPDGIVCDRCTDTLPGYPLSRVQTDESGRFTLYDVPAGANIPLVIASGKWRRTLTISNVPACEATALPATDTRFPKNRGEGSIPKIAITTGDADALECLVRKLGIEDSEIGKEGTPQRIHLYDGDGSNKFAAGFAGASGSMSSATPFWSSTTNLNKYDIVILSCEGEQGEDTKPQAALDAMKAFADAGGRVFASHWHNIWIGGAWQAPAPQTPAVWNSIATWENVDNFASGTDIIDEVNNPKGGAFATWMLNVMGSTVRGRVDITEPRITVTGIDGTKAERWVYIDRNGREWPQIFQFSTPNESPPAQRCGKVVFSDMHVSADSDSKPDISYPDGCSTTPLTPQEKALAFMFFDIATCVASPIL